MSHKIIIAGIGPGSVDYISPAALNAIQSAKILIGGQRALNYFATNDQISFTITANISAVIEFIREKILLDDVVVMVSGDPGYYSMLDILRKNFPADSLKVLPSISSIQLAFARLALSWNNATLISFHGRRPTDDQLKFSEGKIIGMLTDSKYNSKTIAEILIANGWSGDSKFFICSRLSYDDEKIISTTLNEALTIEEIKHCILIVKS